MAVAAASAGNGGIILPDLLKGDVVLQQRADARLWGKAAPGAELKVITSWNGAEYETVAGADSLWFISVATPEAGFTPYDITFSCGPDRLVLEDVLIGDVWFCGGQSNMEMPLKGMFGCYVEGADEAIAMSGRNKGLRYVTVARNKATEEDGSYFTEGSWTASSPATAADFSATAFFFGEALSEALGIPIGLISCSWSGSFIEDWMSAGLFEEYPDQKVFGAEAGVELYGKRHDMVPGRVECGQPRLYRKAGGGGGTLEKRLRAREDAVLPRGARTLSV